MVARDIALAELHRRTPARRARQHGAAPSRWSATRKRRGARGHAPRSRRIIFTLTDEAVAELRHQRQDEPAAAHGTPTSRRCARRLADGTIDAIATDHAPHHRDEKDVEFDQRRARHRRARDRAGAVLALVADGVLDLPTLIARSASGRRGILGVAAGHARRRRGGGRHAHRPGAALDGGGARLQVEEPQHAVRRLGDRRPRGRDLSSAAASSTTSSARPTLRVASRRRRRRARPSWPWPTARSSAAAPSAPTARPAARSSSTPRMTGYQEILTDPSYRRAARRDDVPRDRQRRREPRGRRVAPALRARASSCASTASRRRNWRAEQSLGDYLRATASSASRASTPARSSATCATHGAQEAVLSSSRSRSPSGSCASARRRAQLVGRTSCARSPASEPYDWTEGPWKLERLRIGRRDRGRAGRPASSRRLRLRHQVQHPAQPRRRRLSRARRAGDHAGRRRARARSPTASSSRTARAIPTRSRTRARTSPRCSARCRSSASASATRSSASRSAARPTSSSSATTAATSR